MADQNFTDPDAIGDATPDTTPFDLMVDVTLGYLFMF